MAMNRDLQRLLLVELEKRYPESMEGHEINDALHGKYHSNYISFEDGFDGIDELTREMSYLEEHSLIELYTTIGLSTNGARITAKGRDFLENDGGLSAILNTVTVKFDAENIRSLIEEGLLKADMPQKSKDGILANLRALPGKALETVALEFIKKAISNPTEALSTMRSVLGPMGITF